MPFSFNPFTGNFDNTPSTTKGDSAYSNQSNYLPLTGGTLTGNTKINANLTVYGNISATGNSYFANTIYSTTSALSVVNIGNSGPALYVGNNGTGDIASFYDIDQNIEVLHIGGNNSLFPNVGVKTSTPNVEFTVNGRISASNIIYTLNGNSNEWNSNYTLVRSKSSTWDSAYSTAGADVLVRSLTSGWDGGNSAYTTVNSNSANWNYQGTDIKTLTGFWDASRTFVNNNSASLTNVYNLTANYTSVYSNVSSNSANWQNTYSNQSNYLPLSGGIVTGIVSILSSLEIGTGVSTLTVDNYLVSVNGELSSNSIVYSNYGNSNNWNSVYSNVNTNSAAWGTAGSGIDSGVRALTANYSSVYSNVNTNSAAWRLEDFIVACSDESTSLTTTTTAVTFRIPFGMYLNSVRASVNVAPVGSTIIVDVKQTGSSIFSTKLSIDASEETSTTAATPAVISNPNLTDDAKVVVSVDQVGSSTAGKGLKLTFKGYRI